MAPKDKEYYQIFYQRAAEKKTHISFPQLKYPSLRDEARHPVVWLAGKAMDDGAEGLWRVHNGIYDLTEFVDRHPGGQEWLDLTKGTDITEAFESHHLNPIVYKMLEKYYVREATTPRNSPFTFHEDGFYKTLKRAAVEELKKIPKDVNKHSNMIIDGFLIAVLASSALACWVTNYWLKMAFYLLAAQTLTWLVSAAHNYLHRKDNWRMYLFNLCLWSYRDFRVSHVLSHHLYPNTLMDLEISVFEPIIFWNPGKKPAYAFLSVPIEMVMFPLIFLTSFIYRFSLNFTRKGFFYQHYFWHDMIGLILPVWMYIVGGASLYNTIIMWLWIVCTSSLMFFIVGTNAAHHHPQIFKDGDQVSDVTPDWGMHELEAVMDRKEINGNHFTVMAFFGEHALHHLFPTLDHAILPYLHPVVLEHCEKFRANFRTTNQLDLMLGQIKMTMKTKPTLLEEKN